MSAASRPVALAVRDLSYRYGARAALTDFSLEVGRGEVLGLMGPNGSGKSTALQLMAGLLGLQQGFIRYHGVMGPTFEVGDRGYAARLGMVFQSPSLDRSLTGRDNLVLAGRMHGLRGQDAARRADTLLTWAGLSERAKDRVKTYSGGMTRRLDLARAVIHTPELLLLDEPTAGLDAASFSRTWALVDDLRTHQRTTVIVATHQPNEATRCDRLALVSNGRVIEVASPEALRRKVARDMVVLEIDTNVADAASIEAQLASTFGDSVRRIGDSIALETDEGHTLIPRVVEMLPTGAIEAIALRRPSLGDVFTKLTGTDLDVDVTASDVTTAEAA